MDQIESKCNKSTGSTMSYLNFLGRYSSERVREVWNKIEKAG